MTGKSAIPKISVIIPVYKTEAYLRECLDSVAAQTFRNLEIILVDDGSPDSCGEICDQYAERDERIRVIHQENKGVSAARNAALEIATGEYIGFVDSDDCIEANMYEYLFENLLESGAQIAVCSRIEEFRFHKIFRGWGQSTVLTAEQALKQLLEDDHMQNYVWDKLYCRDILDGVRFPEGKCYEDTEIQYLLLNRARTVVCLPAACYHYRFRPESIVNSLALDVRFHRYEASEKRRNALREKYPDFNELLDSQHIICAAPIWSAYYANPRNIRAAYRDQIQEISLFVKEHQKLIKKNQSFGRATRMIVCLMPYTTWWAFAIAGGIGLLYRIKNGRSL